MEQVLRTRLILKQLGWRLRIIYLIIYTPHMTYGY